MKFYSKQQVELALKQMLEWHEYDNQVYTDSMTEDFWELLGCTDDMKNVQPSIEIEKGIVL